MSAIRANYWESVDYIEAIEKGLSSHQVEVERYFEANGIDVHKSWAFSTENRQVIKEISAYIGQETGEIRPIPIVRLWQYLIAWVVVQRNARRNLWCFKKDPERPEESRLKEMSYFCKYAVAIYGKLLVSVFIKSKFKDLLKKVSVAEILATYTEIPMEEILYINPNSEQFLPVHAICRDTAKSTIVVCIRGTLSIFDALTDLNAVYSHHIYTDPQTGEELARGFVHKGIMTGAQNLAAALTDRVKEALLANPDYSLVVVGHSLGAGSTGLLTLLWLSDPFFVSRGLRSYAYAPPPVFSDDFSKFVRPHMMSSVLGNDLVTRLSYGTIKDLVFIMREFDTREQRKDALRASEIATTAIYGKRIQPHNLTSIYNELIPMLDTPKLVLPGFIYQMYDTIRNFEAAFLQKDRRYVGEFAHSDCYSQIVFDKTLVTDHMPDLYENALKALIS